jgi:hypothetical protein
MKLPSYLSMSRPHHSSGVTARSTNPGEATRYRPRDFGIGYGTSSGYAAPRRYAEDRACPAFRCG